MWLHFCRPLSRNTPIERHQGQHSTASTTRIVKGLRACPKTHILGSPCVASLTWSPLLRSTDSLRTLVHVLAHRIRLTTNSEPSVALEDWHQLRGGHKSYSVAYAYQKQFLRSLTSFLFRLMFDTRIAACRHVSEYTHNRLPNGCFFQSASSKGWP